MACLRAPDGAGGRRQELEEFQTFTRDHQQLREWLVEQGVSKVAMEATGVFWKPVWYVLEGAGFELLLANARHVKNLPGRKTDACDAAWLAQLLECGLLRGSFVPPRQIARLRDLTRYRAKVVAERAHEASAPEAARRRRYQARLGGQQHSRCLMPTHDRGPHRRQA
jgi:transposase